MMILEGRDFCVLCELVCMFNVFALNISPLALVVGSRLGGVTVLWRGGERGEEEKEGKGTPRFHSKSSFLILKKREQGLSGECINHSPLREIYTRVWIQEGR